MAFLRAINLGSRRRFPNDAITAATQHAGGRGVATFGGTGNVRLDSSRRSSAAVAADLEAAYAADRGFAVPVVVLTTEELAEIVDQGHRLEADRLAPGKHYITLYAAAPPEEAVAGLAELTMPGESCLVRGRAAHALLDDTIGEAQLLRSPSFAALGEGTARTLAVLTTLRERWCRPVPSPRR